MVSSIVTVSAIVAALLLLGGTAAALVGIVHVVREAREDSSCDPRCTGRRPGAKYDEEEERYECDGKNSHSLASRASNEFERRLHIQRKTFFPHHDGTRGQCKDINIGCCCFSIVCTVPVAPRPLAVSSFPASVSVQIRQHTVLALRIAPYDCPGLACASFSRHRFNVYCVPVFRGTQVVKENIVQRAPFWIHHNLFCMRYREPRVRFGCHKYLLSHRLWLCFAVRSLDHSRMLLLHILENKQACLQGRKVSKDAQETGSWALYSGSVPFDAHAERDIT